MNSVTSPRADFGADIVLRPFGPGDFARLISWVPEPAAQLDVYLKSAAQPNVRSIFTAMQGGRAVGHVEISHIWPHLSSRLSRVLVAPELRRRGIGTAMLAEALVYSFTEHRVHHVDLGVPTGNSAAIACYHKLGFVLIDTWPQAIASDGASLDVDWMRLTCTTWTAQTRKEMANKAKTG